jgi:glycosyltransferase involved in cell wall biosynthesis
MMRAMSRLGTRIGLVSRSKPAESALDGAALERIEVLDDESGAAPSLSLGMLEERYRSYWGTPASNIARFAEIASEFQADAVVVSGLDSLPMLSAVTSAIRVWYAADEWFWHHVSQIRVADRRMWRNLRGALVKGLYERAYRDRIDRVWVVSERDARAMRLVAGIRQVDVLPNGVDAEWFQPVNDPAIPNTAVFWGRLDFGPNVQALEYFCRDVWPLVRSRVADARFAILGFNPSAEVRELASAPGVELHADLPDLRKHIAAHAVVVLPFVSGGGIKNKLLEAAAMGKPIVCSTAALSGLQGGPPVHVAKNALHFADALARLWSDQEARAAQGEALRRWVTTHHDWSSVAATALDRLFGSRERSAASF